MRKTAKESSGAPPQVRHERVEWAEGRFICEGSHMYLSIPVCLLSTLSVNKKFSLVVLLSTPCNEWLFVIFLRA